MSSLHETTNSLHPTTTTTTITTTTTTTITNGEETSKQTTIPQVHTQLIKLPKKRKGSMSSEIATEKQKKSKINLPCSEDEYEATLDRSITLHERLDDLRNRITQLIEEKDNMMEGEGGWDQSRRNKERTKLRSKTVRLYEEEAMVEDELDLVNDELHEMRCWKLRKVQQETGEENDW